jgi:hypothetical protein
MTGPSIELFARARFDGVLALVAAVGWSEYTVVVERTSRALSASGFTTLVAIDDGRVVGAIQIRPDDFIQALDRTWRWGHVRAIAIACARSYAEAGGCITRAG